FELSNDTVGNGLETFHSSTGYTGTFYTGFTGPASGMGTRNGNNAVIIGAKGVARMKIDPTAGTVAYAVTSGTFVDMTPNTGTFTMTYTGFASNPTCTSTWSRISKIVVLLLCQATGTSNATTMTGTGMPAEIQPAALTQNVAVDGIWLLNNGAST